MRVPPASIVIRLQRQAPRDLRCRETAPRPASETDPGRVVEDVSDRGVEVALVGDHACLEAPLEEVTVAVVAPVEPHCVQAVQALQGEKTVIIVAHRLSTVEYCDRLYRLEDSRIVDQGSFHEVTGRSKE